MNNPFKHLSELYEKMQLNEADKSNLQNPSADEIGDLKTKQDFFGEKPKVVEGPDKAKLAKGPSYKETTGTASTPKTTKSQMPKSSPIKETNVNQGEEMEDTEVDPTDEEEKDESENKQKKNIKEENFTMSSFDTLFRKTILEEVEDEPSPVISDDISEEDTEQTDDIDISNEEAEEEELEEEEGDLISDLRDLQDRLASILDKLENIQTEEDEHESSEESYSDDEFDEEFGDTEDEGEGEGEFSFKESIDRPKPLNSSRGKTLMNKKNKVSGKIHAKGGKAYSGSLKNEPNPKSLGDKKGSLQKGTPIVKSTVTKGDFIK